MLNLLCRSLAQMCIFSQSTALIENKLLCCMQTQLLVPGREEMLLSL